MRVRYIIMPMLLLVCILIYRMPRLRHAQKQTDMTKTIFIFMGRPGSGKSTLAEQCRHALGYNILSIDIMRFIPQKTIEKWLLKHLATEQAVVLDGYPQTVREARQLSNFIKRQRSVKCQMVVVKLEVPEPEALTRVAERLVCSNSACQSTYSRTLLSLTCPTCQASLIRRGDDYTPHAQRRLQVYADNEQHLTAFYQHHGCQLQVLNGTKHYFQLFDELKKIM